MTPLDRATKMIDAMGGEAAVRDRIQSAVAAEDLRWALELASLLVDRAGDDATHDNAVLLASVLRQIASCSPSANVRNWALTRALSLEGDSILTDF